jgi:hypothetical protein
MVERGAPARRIAERSAVLFLYTSAINVIKLILAGTGLVLGPSRPLSNPYLSIVLAPASNLIPVPSGIGVLDGSMIGMLAIYGVGETSCATRPRGCAPDDACHWRASAAAWPPASRDLCWLMKSSHSCRVRSRPGS